MWQNKYVRDIQNNLLLASINLNTKIQLLRNISYDVSFPR
jgi:hypothetical protein